MTSEEPKQGDVISLWQTNRGQTPIIRVFELPGGKMMRVRIAPGQVINMKRELKRQQKAGLI